MNKYLNYKASEQIQLTNKNKKQKKDKLLIRITASSKCYAKGKSI